MSMNIYSEGNKSHSTPAHITLQVFITQAEDQTCPLYILQKPASVSLKACVWKKRADT